MVKSNKSDVKQSSESKKTTPKRQTVVEVVATSPAKGDETVLIGGIKGGEAHHGSVGGGDCAQGGV